MCVLKMINRSNFTINIFFFIFISYIFSLVYWQRKSSDGFTFLHHAYGIFLHHLCFLAWKRFFVCFCFVFCISIFSKMFSLVVTLFQKYRKSTEYIHNLGIAPPLFEICPRVGFCLKFTPDFLFFCIRQWSQYTWLVLG